MGASKCCFGRGTVGGRCRYCSVKALDYVTAKSEKRNRTKDGDKKVSAAMG